MKVNLAINKATYKQNNAYNKSNIAFGSKLISLLDGKLQKFGQKLVKAYEEDSDLANFPCDTFLYKENGSLIVDTKINVKDKIRDILTAKPLIDLDTRKIDPVMNMLHINHQTAAINMVA